jgi:hypothetical protein
LGEKLAPLSEGIPAMRLASAAALALAAFALSGCLAYDVASTAVGAATTVVSTSVDVATGAVCTVACSSGDSDKKK